MILSHTPQKFIRYFASFCLLLALATTSAAPVGPVKHAKGLLWRISSPGLAPSFLFGTMHSTDPRVTALPEKLTSAFDHSSSFSMELIFTGAGIVRMAEIMFYGKSESLKENIGDELYAKTLAAYKTAGISTRDLDKKKPWAVIIALGSSQKPQGALFLDLKLQQKAALQFKPTYGLETMDEQLQVFAGLSLEDQIQLLREALNFQSSSAEQMQQLMRAYLARDLAELASISDRYQSKAGPAYDRLMDRLLAKRNDRMLQRMAPRLKEGGAFIAVGALHLPGNRGLLSLLEGKGYKVTAIY